MPTTPLSTERASGLEGQDGRSGCEAFLDAIVTRFNLDLELEEQEALYADETFQEASGLWQEFGSHVEQCQQYPKVLEKRAEGKKQQVMQSKMEEDPEISKLDADIDELMQEHDRLIALQKQDMAMTVLKEGNPLYDRLHSASKELWRQRSEEKGNLKLDAEKRSSLMDLSWEIFQDRLEQIGLSAGDQDREKLEQLFGETISDAAEATAVVLGLTNSFWIGDRLLSEKTLAEAREIVKPHDERLQQEFSSRKIENIVSSIYVEGVSKTMGLLYYDVAQKKQADSQQKKAEIEIQTADEIGVIDRKLEEDRRSVQRTIDSIESQRTGLIVSGVRYVRLFVDMVRERANFRATFEETRRRQDEAAE